MLNRRTMLTLILALSSGPSSIIAFAEPGAPVAIAIHAGAGTISKEEFTASMELEIRGALMQAVQAGHKVLSAGGSSLDAITLAITILEDSPHFNAGRGAVFNAEGRHELDASIMDGSNLEAGAVAGVQNIRNPILLARKIMTDSVHVMLMGEGAEVFARANGIEFADPDYFFTERRWQQLQKARNKEKQDALLQSESPDRWLSTVGAVALDANGNLAAATSTGGMTNKRWGRVGDSPIIGAGTYADNRSCAVSATGHGEYFIRATVARDICSRVQYQGLDLASAADAVINGQLRDMGGDGGIIALDTKGNIALTFNTPGMYRASVDVEGNLEVRIYKDE
ncbi:MAG: isoaspartyl peptidase/L-asparaginase [Proteobacteria bacterium]|nr:isoaspartyl peptidase/L-asparaginase [Pseudomonadota bacterium]MCH8227259.1 isoaspartyl peptidase/L-asparaginase [Pseudomonadota bacterium]